MVAVIEHGATGPSWSLVLEAATDRERRLERQEMLLPEQFRKRTCVARTIEHVALVHVDVHVERLDQVRLRRHHHPGS